MSTQASHFESAGGALVPVDKSAPPDEVAKEREHRQRTYPPLLKYLVSTCDAVAALDRSERVRIREAQARAGAYYDGRQDGYVRNGVWYDNPYVEGEIIPEDNQYKIQVDKLNMEMTRADVAFEVEPTDKSDAEMVEAAKFLKDRLEVNRARTETEAFKQSENLSLLVKSITYRHVFFDPNAEGDGEERKPRLAQLPAKESMRVTVCRTCEMPQGVGGEVNSLDPQEFEAGKYSPCERCGDTARKELSVTPSGGLDITYEKVPGGRVVTVRPDASQVQLDMSARSIQTSPFLRWTLSLRRCEWERMFPGRRIPKDTRSGEARWADDLQSNPSNAGWGGEGYEAPREFDITGGEQFERIEGELVWLDNYVYADYSNKENEKLQGGGVLPAGASLIERFPDGLCVARIGSTVLDLYPSNKNERWSMCVYGLREHALHGAGTFSLLGVADTINNLNAYIQANNAYNAAPKEFIRSGAFQAANMPTVSRVGIVEAGYPQDKPIVGYAYDKSQPSSLAADVYQFREHQRGSLQEHAGTSSLSMQGAADMRALGTATGVEAARDQAVGRIIPNLKLKADMQAEWAYQVAMLERENLSPDLFGPRAGKASEGGEVRFTERGVKAFFRSNVRRDFIIRPVPESLAPRTQAQEKANKSEFALIAGQLSKLPGGAEILAKLAPAYGVEYEVNEWGATARAASLRLREYARVAAVITQAGYPASDELAEVVLTQVLEWARVNDALDNHPAYIDFYSDWWVSDEGLQADPLLRLVVEKVHALHKGGTVAQAQKEGEAEALAQLPGKAAEQFAAESDARLQMELEAERADMEDEREVAKAAVLSQVVPPEAVEPVG